MKFRVIKKGVHNKFDMKNACRKKNVPKFFTRKTQLFIRVSYWSRINQYKEIICNILVSKNECKIEKIWYLILYIKIILQKMICLSRRVGRVILFFLFKITFQVTINDLLLL